MRKKTKFKVSDVVTVISGRDKKKSGKILSIFQKKSKVYFKIEGINVVKRAAKKTFQSAGSFSSKNALINSSKVMFFSEKDNSLCKIYFNSVDTEKKRQLKISKRKNSQEKN